MTEVSNKRWPRWWRRAQIAVRRTSVMAVLEIAAAIAFLLMTAISWYAVSSRAGTGRLLPSDLTATLLVGTLVPAMAVLVLLGRRIALQRAKERHGGNGRLHVRLVFLFSIISAVPTIIVVVFASWLFQSGVEFWFSDKSRGLLKSADDLARGYSEQLQRDMQYESLAMAGDLREFLTIKTITSPEFRAYYADQWSTRKLNESVILQKGTGGTLNTAAFALGDNPLDSKVSTDVVRKLDGGVAIVVSANASRIQAVTPIDRRAGLYLYTARSSDLLSSRRAANIVRDYDALTKRARVLQLRFNVALFIASVALVGLAVWFALRFADRFVKPIYDLVDAARQVGAGNFSMQVAGRTGSDEIGLLNRAFNRMTQQLDRQTQALVGANQQLDERRAFIEAVLESVTAGVISIDPAGNILLMNSSAQKLLLDAGSASPVGETLESVSPALAAIAEARQTSGIVQHAKGGDLLTLAVKASAETAGRVITFEDITRQLLDQRQAAWSDVARRIAHEIKNPLTPIQLATERLNRRYKKQISADPELFEELTSTIIRQVGDLRKMVDEFSSFARIPKPVFRGEDPVDLARQALFLQEVARPDINFAFSSPRDVGLIACDRHQFGQAMTNVLKNAVEAIEAQQRQAAEGYRGEISVSLTKTDSTIAVKISDNGIGLPQERDRIAEPYVTTREKGTGLGLAIVKKIVEEHGGDMSFGAAPSGGTEVTLRFARDPLADTRAQDAAE